VTADADSYPPQLAVGVTSTRIRALRPAARAVHKAILRGFAATSRAPDAATLAAAYTDQPSPNGHRAAERPADGHIVPAAPPADDLRST